ACTAAARGTGPIAPGSSIFQKEPHPAPWSSKSSPLHRSCSHPSWQSERAARETRQPKAGVRRDGVDAARTLLSCTKSGHVVDGAHVIAMTAERQRADRAGEPLRRRSACQGGAVAGAVGRRARNAAGAL